MMAMLSPFEEQLKTLIQSIPVGRVCTYSALAAYAGHPRAARQVSRFLRQHARAFDLPWFRIINAQGRISKHEEAQQQRVLLEAEGIRFSPAGGVDLKKYLWAPVSRASSSEMTR